jgi:hypothetical protein
VDDGIQRPHEARTGARVAQLGGPARSAQPREDGLDPRAFARDRDVHLVRQAGESAGPRGREEDLLQQLVSALGALGGGRVRLRRQLDPVVGVSRRADAVDDTGSEGRGPAARPIDGDDGYGVARPRRQQRQPGTRQTRADDENLPPAARTPRPCHPVSR